MVVPMIHNWLCRDDLWRLVAQIEGQRERGEPRSSRTRSGQG